MRVPKILHIITTLNRGGAEIQLLALVGEQIRLGNEVSIVSLKGENELEELFLQSGAFVHSEVNGCNILIVRSKLKKLIAKNYFDIVHAHLPRAEILAALSVGLTPLVVTRHNSEAFFPRPLRLLSRMLSLLVEKRASSIIFISESAKRFALNLGEVVNESIHHVIHYGTSATKVQSREYLPSKPLKILTVGRLVQQKDHLTQIKALNMLPRGLYELSIYGEGILRQSLHKRINEFGLEKWIFLKGNTSEIREIYQEHDVFVLSSVYEGFGLVLLEAIEAGIPIIASDIPTSREILGENFTHFFTPGDSEQLANRILSLNNINSYDFYALANRLNLFQLEETAVKHNSLYHSVLNFRF
jgi:glycosyltransferase involved in cell wall biosynthesis